MPLTARVIPCVLLPTTVGTNPTEEKEGKKDP